MAIDIALHQKKFKWINDLNAKDETMLKPQSIIREWRRFSGGGSQLLF